MDFIIENGGSNDSVGDQINIGIITVSDRAYKGEYIDEGGPKVIDFFSEIMDSKWTTYSIIIPDEKHKIMYMCAHVQSTIVSDFI